MATPSKGKDRRAQRTRDMLRLAFFEVVREKGFAGVSVQAITERANVSRGTFYAHYEDKYALADSIVRENFRQAISSLPTDWNRNNLRRLVQTLLDYFREIVKHLYRSGDVGTLLERAIHEELTSFILTMIKQAPEICSPLSPESIAQITSWAVFGAALHWTQTKPAISSEQMADEVVRMLMDGVTRLVPETHN